MSDELKTVLVSLAEACRHVPVNQFAFAKIMADEPGISPKAKQTLSQLAENEKKLWPIIGDLGTMIARL